MALKLSRKTHFQLLGQNIWFVFHNSLRLKYGFYKKYFRKNEPLTSWTLFSPVFFQISTESALIWKKQGEKVFNWSEVHFFGSTSYEIHTLVACNFNGSFKTLALLEQPVVNIDMSGLIKKNQEAYSLMPGPCSHFYFDINFGNRSYWKEKRQGSPLLFRIYVIFSYEHNLLPNLISK